MEDCVKIAYEYAKQIDELYANTEITEDEASTTTTTNISSNAVNIDWLSTGTNSDGNITINQKCNNYMVVKTAYVYDNIIDITTNNNAATAIIILYDMLDMTDEDSYANKPTETRWHETDYVEQWLKDKGLVDESWTYTYEWQVIDYLTDYYEDRIEEINQDIDIVITSIITTLTVSAQSIQSNLFDYNIVSGDGNVEINMTNENITEITAILTDYATAVNNVSSTNTSTDNSTNTSTITTTTPTIATGITTGLTTGIEEEIEEIEEDNTSTDVIIIISVIIISITCVIIGFLIVIVIKHKNKSTKTIIFNN